MNTQPHNEQSMQATAVASLDEIRSVRRAASEGLPKSIKRPFAKTTSAPSEGLPMKHAFSRASSASACTQDNAVFPSLGLSGLEALETLQYIVSSEADFSSYQTARSVDIVSSEADFSSYQTAGSAIGPHSVPTNNSLLRAQKYKKVDKTNTISGRHRLLPLINSKQHAATNVVISQDLIDRSNARTRIATRTSSSESRGTRQMVAFCETERLKARFSSAKVHSSMETKRPESPALFSGSPTTMILSTFQTWLVPCMLCVILLTLFVGL